MAWFRRLPGFIGPVPPPLLIRECPEIVEDNYSSMGAGVSNHEFPSIQGCGPGAQLMPPAGSGDRKWTLHRILCAEFLPRGFAAP